MGFPCDLMMTTELSVNTKVTRRAFTPPKSHPAAVEAQVALRDMQLNCVGSMNSRLSANFKSICRLIEATASTGRSYFVRIPFTL
jgi:hypothetical protein